MTERTVSTGYGGVTNDTLGNEFIIDIQQAFEAKIFDPSQREDATQQLLRLRNSWAHIGQITVFTCGVFDMMHPDHAGYLLHTKALGAPNLYEQDSPGNKWEDLDTTQKQNFTRFALASDTLKLIVSIDGDRSVAIRKGFNPDKGNAVRPIFAWQTRAFQVAKESFVRPGQDVPTLAPTVDAVTIHGNHDFSPDNPHHSHFELAKLLQPDVWAIFEESKDIIDAAPLIPELGSVALRCIEDTPDRHYFEDDVMGKIHTSSIISRIKQA